MERISKETWRLIFGWATGEEGSRINPLRVAITLSHVCHEWRNISVSHPSLWNRMTLDVNSANGLPDERLLQQCMNRARNTPLTIIWKYRGGGSRHVLAQSPLLVRKTMRMIMSNLHRIEYLRVPVGFYGLRSADLEHIPNEGGKLLRHLRLDNRSSDLNPGLVKLFESAPNLTRLGALKLTCGNHYDLMKLKIPFAQLTHLTVRIIMYDNLLSILSNSVNLVRCVASCIIDPSIDEFPSGHIRVLRNLKELRMAYDRGLVYQDDDVYSSDYILACINAPQLEILSIENEFDWSQSEVMRFLRYSGSNLHTFRVRCIPMDDNKHLLEVLGAMPALRHFELRQCDPSCSDPKCPKFTETEAVGFQLRDEQTGDFSLCPQLERISIDFGRLCSEDDDTPFATTVEARWADGDGALKKVEVNGFNASDSMYQSTGGKYPFEIVNLLLLKHNGLSVTIDARVM